MKLKSCELQKWKLFSQFACHFQGSKSIEDKNSNNAELLQVIQKFESNKFSSRDLIENLEVKIKIKASKVKVMKKWKQRQCINSENSVDLEPTVEQHLFVKH